MSPIRFATVNLAGILLCLFTFLAQASSHLADSLEGRVIKITDGNTLTIMLPESDQLKIKMAGIDAPEKNQPHYQIAKQALSDKIFTEDVRVEIVSWEKNNLAIANVILNGEYVNSWMVDEGHAWASPQESDDSELADLQASARAGMRGIWALSDTERVPPWEWRQGKRIGSRQGAVPARAYTCGSKNSCQEMTSCDEAKFYLRQCFLLRLDDDNDGIPCESLCN